MIAKVASRRRRRSNDQTDEQYIGSMLRMPWNNPSRTLLCFVLVFGIVGLVYLMAPAKYSARTDVVVVAITSPSQTISDRDVSIDSAVQILYSDSVLGKTARELEYPERSSGLLDELTISPLINSRLLRIYVANEDPYLAYDAVNLLTKNFLEERRTRLENLAETRRTELTLHTASLRKQIADLDARQLAESENRTLRRDLSAQLTDLEFALAAIDTIAPDPGFISRESVVPTRASRPPATVYLASALALAIVLSFLVAPNQRSVLTGQRAATARKSLSLLFGGTHE